MIRPLPTATTPKVIVMKDDFTPDELKTAFDALEAALAQTKVYRRLENGDRMMIHVPANEFMLMQQGPAGKQSEDWWHFKHRDTRNYLFLRVRDKRVWAPVTDEHFMQGEF